jgi:hypothetical protein
VLDKELYRKVNQNGQVGVWVLVSGYPDILSRILLDIIEEILDETRTG